MFVIGTAGHVDHGKSTLISYLTGINPDRLKEEQERQMTIDLGFAWFSMPSGEEVGIVDVPGHQDFIENMLSGVAGLDAVLFIIAADEGIMPQTREHFDILKLLKIQKGITVLTKIDLVDDREWIDLVEKDFRDLATGSFLEDSPIVKISAVKKSGKEELIKNLSKVLSTTQEKKDIGRPRLPIDRVFSLKGFGTIVTGTLQEGYLSVGDQVEIQPAGLTSRIRSIQNHKRKVTRALPGSRTALNLVGVEVDQIRRGDVVCLSDTYKPTRFLDTHIEVLKNFPAKLSHNDRVKFFIGSDQKLTRVRVIGSKAIDPDSEGWAQLVLEEPVIASDGDRFIIRRPSPPSTIGGGVVLDAHSVRRHKRFTASVIERFKSLYQESDEEKIFFLLTENGMVRLSDFINRNHLNKNQTIDLLANLITNGRVIVMGDQEELTNESWISTSEIFLQKKNQIINIVRDFHEEYPLRKGMLIENCVHKTDLEKYPFQQIAHSLLNEGKVKIENTLISLPEFSVKFTEKQELKIKELEELFQRHPYQPPMENECKKIVGEDVYDALVISGELIKITSAIVFQKIYLSQIINDTKILSKKNGKITVAQFRDYFRTSRKYAIALLEYFDRQGITKREGDFRTLIQ